MKFPFPSESWTDCQLHPSKYYMRQVYLYRRYWDATTKSYVWESTGEDITDKVKSYGNIVWNLDSEQLNVWRMSNTSLVVDNKNNEWNKYSPVGIFSDDDNEIEYMSKIQIKLGYNTLGTYPDLSEDEKLQYVYTGLIEEIQDNYNTKTATIKLVGFEKLLKIVNAEELSISPTDLIYYNADSPYNATTIKRSDGGSWATDEHAGREVEIFSGYGKGQTRTIISNTADTLTISSGATDWDTIPNATSDFRIIRVTEEDVYTSGNNYLTVETCNWNDDEWNGYGVKITEGTGCGQFREITDTVAAENKIIVKTNWSTNPDTTSVFKICAEKLTATGNPNEYETSMDGIGRIVNVWDNEDLLEKGNEYTVADERDKDSTAKVTTSAAAVGNVLAEYIAYYQGQTVDWIVEELVKLTDIENYDINVSILPNVAVTVEEDSAFTGTLTDIEERNEDLQLEYLWDDNSYFAEGDQLPSEEGWSRSTSRDDELEEYMVESGTRYVVKINPALSNNNVVYKRSVSMGTDWAFEWRGQLYGFSTLPFTNKIYISFRNIDEHNGIIIDGYSRQVTIKGTTDETVSVGTESFNTYRLIKDGSDLKLYINGELEKTATYDSGNPVQTNFRIAYEGRPTNGYVYYKTERFTYSEDKNYTDEYLYPSTGDYMSTTEDCSTSVVSYGQLKYAQIQTGSGDYIKWYSRSQDADSGWPTTWGDWDELENGQIVSDVKRYLRVRCRFYADTTRKYTTIMQNYSFEYVKQEIKIPFVDLTGLTVQEACEELAGFAGYEVGVDANGTFFFRDRTANTEYVIDFTDYATEIADKFYTDNIIGCSVIKDHFSFLYNRIRVSYGTYSEEVSSITECESRPHSIDKYGEHFYQLSGGNLLLGENNNLAKGIAEKLYNDLHTLKKYARLVNIPYSQIDLGDTVVCTLKNEQFTWVLGDTHISLGDEHIFLHDGLENILRLYEKSMKVIGINIDLNNFKETFELRGI